MDSSTNKGNNEKISDLRVGGGKVQFGSLGLEVVLSHINGDANQTAEIPV